MFFSTKRRIARAKYQEFVADGIDRGKRNELVGGGLRRVRQGLGNDVIAAYDDRILGSSEFVMQLREEKEIADRFEIPISLQTLMEFFAGKYGVSIEDLAQRRRGSALSEAKSIICYVSTHRLGYSGEIVGKTLGITRAGVCRGSVRGENAIKENLSLKDEMEVLINRSTTGAFTTSP